VLAPPL
jgi:hypothetical protein